MPPLKVIQYIHKYIFLIIKNKFTLLINKKRIIPLQYSIFILVFEESFLNLFIQYGTKIKINIIEIFIISPCLVFIAPAVSVHSFSISPPQILEITLKQEIPNINPNKISIIKLSLSLFFIKIYTEKITKRTKTNKNNKLKLSIF